MKHYAYGLTLDFISAASTPSKIFSVYKKGQGRSFSNLSLRQRRGWIKNTEEEDEEGGDLLCYDKDSACPDRRRLLLHRCRFLECSIPQRTLVNSEHNEWNTSQQCFGRCTAWIKVVITPPWTGDRDDTRGWRGRAKETFGLKGEKAMKSVFRWKLGQ